MQRTVVTLIDDLDGSEAVETIRFMLDGVEYEIDLSGLNAQDLRDSLDPFVKASRKVGRSRIPAATRTRAGHTGRNPKTAEVREWARSKGIEVNERGRIPAAVMEQYERDAA